MILDHARISESVNILSKVAGILEHVSGHIGVLPTAAAKAEQVLTGVMQYEMGSGKTFGIDNKQHYKEIAKKNNLVQSSKTLPKSGKVGQFLAKAAGALRWLNIGFGVVGVGASYYLYAHAENPTEKFWSGMDIFVGVVSTGLAIAALFISSPVIAAAATIAGVVSLIYFVGRLIF